MKNLFSKIKKAVVAGAAAVGLCAACHAGNTAYPGLLWSVSTNYNVTVGASGTNSSGVITNNASTGVVLGASTNFFNLSSTSGNQPNTNLWPSVGWTMLTSYPNTYAPPANNLTLYTAGALTATNATSTAITFRYAGSVDGSLWVSNYFVQTYTVAINSFTPGPILTNTTTGALPFVALQEIDNPGVAAFTNALLEASAKPGL